jgi:hypothetical protein
MKDQLTLRNFVVESIKAKNLSKMMGKKQDKKEAKCMGLKRKAAHLAFFLKK